MNSNMQTLHDALYALAVVVGVAVTWTLALVAAGTVFARDKAPAAKTASTSTAPALQPTTTDDARELVLR